MMKPVRFFNLIAIAVMFLGLPGCQTNPATGRKQLNLLTEEKEIALGQQSAPEFEGQFENRVPNDTLQSYVAEVGKRVAAVSERQMPYEFSLLASDVPNAFALPGGKIYVTAGLMRRMSNERQLASVLAHEVGHVNARHVVDGLQRSVGLKVLLAAAGYAMKDSAYASAGNKVSEVAAGMANMKFSRMDEYEADMLGLRYMTKAGYNPWGMVELFDVLLKLNEKEGGTLTEMFSTHPLASKRIAETKDIIHRDHPHFNATDPDPQTERFLKMRDLLNSALPAKAKS